MSQFRQDPVTGGWTVVAPERAGRPKDFSRTAAEVADAEGCPFCAGNEHLTPPTRYEAALPGERGWTVRVVENRFPAISDLESEGCSPAALEAASFAPGPYHAAAGMGVHEVIVETPRHDEGLADLTAEHAALLIDTFSKRIEHWGRDGRFACSVLFRNWGQAAGASLAHAHTQLVALPRVPEVVVRELGNFSGGFSSGGGCVLCEAMSADDRDGRTVFDDGMTAVHSPFAAPIPYFMRVAPKRCIGTMTEATEDERASFGSALIAAARAIRGVFGDVAFNVVVHVSPYSALSVEGLPFHWHAEVVLRTSDWAGLEWGSGMYINVIDPDDAARSLREGLERA